MEYRSNWNNGTKWELVKIHPIIFIFSSHWSGVMVIVKFLEWFVGKIIILQELLYVSRIIVLRALNVWFSIAFVKIIVLLCPIAILVQDVARKFLHNSCPQTHLFQVIFFLFVISMSYLYVILLNILTVTCLLSHNIAPKINFADKVDLRSKQMPKPSNTVAKWQPIRGYFHKMFFFLENQRLKLRSWKLE